MQVDGLTLLVVWGCVAPLWPMGLIYLILYGGLLFYDYRKTLQEVWQADSAWRAQKQSKL